MINKWVIFALTGLFTSDLVASQAPLSDLILSISKLGKSPDEFSLLADAGETYADKQRLLESKRDAKLIEDETLVLENPTRIDYLINLGRDYVRSGDPEKAVEVYKRALELDSQRTDVRLSLGYAYLYANNLESSRGEFQTVLNQEPREIEALAGMGRIAALQGQVDEAQSFYEMALSIEADRATPLEFFALLRVQEERHQEAAEIYSKLLKLQPGNDQYKEAFIREERLAKDQEIQLKDVDIYQGLIEIEALSKQEPDTADKLFREKKWPEAEVAYLKLIEDYPNDLDYYVRLGVIYSNLNRLDRAAAQYKTVLEVEPDNDEALELLASVRTREKKYPEAIDLYKRLYTLLPESAYYKEALETALHLPLIESAGKLEGEKQYAEAEDIYRKILEESPDNADIYLKLGRVLVAEKRTDEAIVVYEQGLIAKPNDKDLSRSLAFHHLWKGMELKPSESPFVWGCCFPYIFAAPSYDFMKSREYFESVLSQDSKDVDSLAGLGAVLASTDDLEGAGALYDEAIELDPNSATALSYIAANHTRYHRRFSAESTLGRLSELNPKDEDIQKNYKEAYKAIEPVYSFWTFYDQENEKEQISQIWDARLQNYFADFSVAVPLKDGLKINGGVRDEFIRLENLIRSDYIYSYSIQRVRLGAEWGCNPHWNFSGGCGASYFHPYKRASTFEKSGYFIEPYLTAVYGRNRHTFLIETTASSPLIARNFATNTAAPLGVQILHTFYEYDLGKRRSVGIEGAYGWWYSKVIYNQQQVGSAWLKLTPPWLWENIALKYQFVYGRFNRLTPDFYVYRPQLTHWLKLELTKSWCDGKLVTEAGYWHGWQRSFEQGQIIVINPLTIFKWRNRQINSVVGRIKYNLNDNLDISLNGGYSHETFDYTTASVSGQVNWRF